MLSLELTDDQKAIRDLAHEFAVREIRPVAAHYDEAEETPWEVIRKAAEVGLYGLDILLQAQSDRTGLTHMLINEELYWGCAGIGVCIMGSGLAAAGLYAQGTPEQVFEWMPRIYGTESEPTLGAFCVTEPNAGSDVSALRTRATYDGATGDWILNGTKVFITNGWIADVHVVVAAVEPELGLRGQATFVVSKEESNGTLRQGKKEKKYGIRASHTAEVIFDDCRIPAGQLLGGKERLDAKLEKGRRGESTGRSSGALQAFERTRPIVGIQAVGIARAALEFATDYARTRVQGGRPIIEHQAIAHMLAEMATRVDAARLLCWRAAWMAGQGLQFANAEGSMAKLFAGETAVWVTDRAIQILGGYGYIREYPVEKWHRDAKIYTLWEGTSEMQRHVIGKALAAA